ncbi:MAG: lipopolysaccharide heptosyltransferase II [Desulfuromonadaceae bacterium]|nr:lipopolysaccharide heptosyltransferase II [Desulfuromonadaceae bacterium]MDD2854376.1 lipopolysaccharide heptosyltransferase II [Desulfuromonadaceae bacterium]
MNNNIKRILVLRYRFIGDTILTVPFLRNLRMAEPDAYIAWVVAPGSAEVVSGIPYVNELIFWDPVTIHADSRGTHGTLREKVTFIRELRKKRFDKVYVLKRSFSSALMALVSGARERIGFNTEGRGFLLTKRIPYRPEQHEVLSFLDVLIADEVPVQDDYLESWTTAIEAEEAERILAAAGADKSPLLAIHPFGSIYQKTWPIERFAEVAVRLQDNFNLKPLILGAKGDLAAFNNSQHLFPEGSCNLVGQCSIRITQALLRRSKFFIGNDSGIMHLAAAAGLPLLALFGPTSPKRFGPWGQKVSVIYGDFKCSPCRQKYFTECEPAKAGRPPCIDSISVKRVLDECVRILNNEELL